MAQILSEFGGWPVVVGDSWIEHQFDWIETMKKCRQIGYSFNYLMDFSIMTDLKNSTRRTIDVGLNFKESYFDILNVFFKKQPDNLLVIILISLMKGV